MEAPKSYSAFADSERIAGGDRATVARVVKKLVDAGDLRTLLVFADHDGSQVDLDLRGSLEDVLAAVAATDAPEPAPKPRGPGRPKLGVVGREVTLLPRHWEWLSAQPGGASVTLRKLVDQARSGNGDKDRERRTQEAVYRFIAAMAGNEPGYEEACRALFAGNGEAFATHTAAWPADVREFAQGLAMGAGNDS